jgi:hypothetical protein
MPRLGPRPKERHALTAAIVVVLALLGVGIVVDQLFRLRNWLNKPPPGEPPDTKS